jgi:hypothetical protein
MKQFGNDEMEGKVSVSKWQYIKENLSYKKVIKCTNVVVLRKLSKHLYGIRCKWEN